MNRKNANSPSRNQTAADPGSTAGWAMLLSMMIVGVVLTLTRTGAAQEQEPVQIRPLPAPLSQVAVPLPANLGRYLNTDSAGNVTPEARLAAIRLGKALFWDMQLGSDGVQACASCHYHAGTDNRAKNSLNPGLNGGDNAFEALPAVNDTLKPAHFPLRLLSDRHDRNSTVVRDSNDVVGSQGVCYTDFQSVTPGAAVEGGTPEADPVFTRYARDARRVTARNTPSVINSVFNFANFWDGRANHFFNGVNPFGIEDVNARVLVNDGTTLRPLDMNAPGNKLDNASLASQAVGPPLNDFEMSWQARTFPDIGKKMLSLVPLAKQLVHPTDSVLGPISKAAGTPAAMGLTITYAELIRTAFKPEFWNSATCVLYPAPELTDPTPGNPATYVFNPGEAVPATGGAGYTQMEANFSLFFGLSVMMYQSTLVSDDTPFDRHLRGDVTALTERQKMGMNLFYSTATNCSFCHLGPELTSATVSAARNPLEPGLIEAMLMADGAFAIYDVGYYNVGVRPTSEDIGRGAPDPFGFPLSFSRQFQARDTLPFTPIASPGCIVDPVENPVCPPNLEGVLRTAVDGAFKTPGLRNVELTGPYLHNGGLMTLAQVVDFYTRGSDFRERNIDNLALELATIPSLIGDAGKAQREALVDFLIALTDERVRWEKAPFDHPQLVIPDGHSTKLSPSQRFRLPDNVLELPAVGAAGRSAQGLPPVKSFLDQTGNSASWDQDLHFRF